MNALEAFIASVGIALVGWLSIPLVASLAGVAITTPQAVRMSAMFFALRFGWLWVLRTVFERFKP